MLATVVADYPVEADRGKATGMMGVMNGLGIMFALLVLTRLPQLLSSRGIPPLTAGRIAYGATALLCVVAAIVVARGLMRGRPASAGPARSLPSLAHEALAASRDPAVALAYGAAFVSRGDLAVVGTFLTLWVSQHATEQGMDGSRALAVAGTVMAISQGAAVLWAPVQYCGVRTRLRPPSSSGRWETLGGGGRAPRSWRRAASSRFRFTDAFRPRRCARRSPVPAPLRRSGRT
jgi:hypothetical protein